MENIQQYVINHIMKKTGLEKIGINENLITLGINSLMLIEIFTLICQELEIDYSLIDLNKHQINTVNNLITIIQPYMGLIL
jgi:acyl carrier protein